MTSLSHRFDLAEIVADEHGVEPEDVSIQGASVLGGGEEVVLRAVVDAGPVCRECGERWVEPNERRTVCTECAGLDGGDQS